MIGSHQTSAPTPRHLLIADDDPDMADMLGQSARILWPDAGIAIAPDGTTALRSFAAQRPDLILLDVTMPAPDGLAVCRQIRRADPRVPIIILTGREGALDEVRGLEAGADCYLAKPCDLLRLLAHLRALTRRDHPAPGAPDPPDSPPPRATRATHDLVIDLDAREVCLGGKLVALTPIEWVLLETLARRRGQLVPHQTLLEHTWGAAGTRAPHYLKIYINRLRDKLGDDGRYPRYIETRRGQGYRLIAR